MIIEKERKKMLSLAREAIINFEDKEKISALVKEVGIQKKSGVFVSVYVDGNLRGCIGNLQEEDVSKSIAHNAIMAAYHDYRFPPISKSEYKKMTIHINILTKPEEVFPKSEEELFKLLESKPGLIIQKGYKSATFLPSVWEQLPDKKDFLEHLCEKAGLARNEWKPQKQQGVRFFTYYSEEFSE